MLTLGISFRCSSLFNSTPAALTGEVRGLLPPLAGPGISPQVLWERVLTEVLSDQPRYFSSLQSLVFILLRSRSCSEYIQGSWGDNKVGSAFYEFSLSSPSFFLFFPFLSAPWHMVFPGQGSYLRCSCDRCRSGGSSGSLTHCAGDKPASQCSRDAADPIAPHRGRGGRHTRPSRVITESLFPFIGLSLFLPPLSSHCCF